MTCDDPRIAAVRNVIASGGFRLKKGARVNLGKLDMCDHDKFGFDDCIACYDEALLAALSEES